MRRGTKLEVLFTTLPSNTNRKYFLTFSSSRFRCLQLKRWVVRHFTMLFSSNSKTLTKPLNDGFARKNYNWLRWVFNISGVSLIIWFNYSVSKVFGDSDATCEQRTERNKCCVFPFTYDGEQYYTCTIGGPSNFYWCATTANYDRDGQWDICTGILFSTE